MKRVEKIKQENKGFSLVELIIVIAIMAVLIGILAPQFIKYVEQSRQSADLTTVDEIIQAIQVGCTDPDLGVSKVGNIILKANAPGELKLSGKTEIEKCLEDANIKIADVSLESDKWGKVTIVVEPGGECTVSSSGGTLKMEDYRN